MRATRQLLGLGVCGVLLCYTIPSRQAADAATPGTSTDSSYTVSDAGLNPSLSLAERVLAAEADGDLRERSRLVLDLLESQAADELSRSVAAEIRDRLGWKSIEAKVEENLDLPALDRYERFRSTQPDNVQGHLAAAAWCQRAGLESQQMAHCQRVLQLDSENRIARAALGHRRIDGRWVTPEQMAQLNAEIAALRESLQKYGGKLMKLASDTQTGKPAERQVAAQSLLELDATDATPAVAAIFAAAPRPLIDPAIQWMSERSDPAATAILAQWSIDHPDPAARDLCTAALRQRPLYHYVPHLLERARSPLVSQIIPSFRPDGSLAGVRHVFSREAKDNIDVAVVDTIDVRRRNVNRFRNDGPERLSTIQVAIEDAKRERENQITNAMIDRQNRIQATREAVQRERVAAVENQTSKIVNDRIRLVLSETSGTDPQATLHELWDWWADYTEREPAPIKLATYRYNYQLSTSDFYTTREACECFVAGTPVVTSRGEKPIESIVVGDQVLSKNIETGELVWDVVVTTTTQPAKPLVTVQTDRETFECTGGHLFWVSGKGWTKARDLEYQDLLHGLAQPLQVRAVSEGDAAPTYNLVTDEHHNYFVGKGQVLSHDFNEPEPTTIRVPGLAPVAAR
ncbi:Hint domain-containing protein [Candidatus Laterigemmans baculatus]|uniref:Hint domain-containing protein n=1 Tax=Candidatus Laterigemmans baculatus TaxID=2770505 RepID=UPI0013DABB8A|nr:Hint domain-containing protein [Candidatus Laterigemmans baculatus]